MRVTGTMMANQRQNKGYGLEKPAGHNLEQMPVGHLGLIGRPQEIWKRAVAVA
jgi:hypothetical protein